MVSFESDDESIEQELYILIQVSGVRNVATYHYRYNTIIEKYKYSKIQRRSRILIKGQSSKVLKEKLYKLIIFGE